MKDNTRLMIAAVACLVLSLFDFTLIMFWHVSWEKVSMAFVLFPWGITMLWFAISTRKHH